jgi:hypothetical protein
MTARAITAHGRSVSAAAVTSGHPEWKPSPVTGGQLLALAMSLRPRPSRTGRAATQPGSGTAVLLTRPDRMPPSPSRVPPSRDAFSPIPGEPACPRL